MLYIVNIRDGLMIEVIEKFENNLPLKIRGLKNEIQLIINAVKDANSKNRYVFNSIEAHYITDADGNNGISFKDTSNPNYVDFTDIFLTPPAIIDGKCVSRPLTIIHGKYMVFEEDEFFINTKILKLIFKAYEILRKSVLDREYFKKSHYISQIIDIFEMKIHNAMRHKLNEFAEMTEICKKAKYVKGENITVEYGEDEAMHIKLEKNKVDYVIHLNPLFIKQSGSLTYDFNWTVPNTNINPVILRGFIKLYEEAKVELLKVG
jgi:hypothetical protein